jgi:ZIP family zinc transporter
MSLELIWLGSIASLGAGLATGAGALPVLFAKKVSDRLLDVMLGFSAGVMLAATSFSLIVPAIDLGSPWIVVIGIILGALVLHLIDRFVPHFHPALGPEGPPSNVASLVVCFSYYYS